jgi:hypothetical protein
MTRYWTFTDTPCQWCKKSFKRTGGRQHWCSWQCRFRSIIAPIQKEHQCWEWPNHRFRFGYGAFGIDGKLICAHRVSWQIFNGPISPGLQVLHTCDNPPCVNPTHLFLGTIQDNMEDRTSKDRGAKKLSRADVLAIRASTRLQREIAEEFGVTNSVVSEIKNRRLWKHVE